MKEKKFIKSLNEYDTIEFDEEASLNARRINRKMPTSVSLPEDVVKELKELAHHEGIPYQVLMRSFIIKGLREAQKK